MHAHTHSPESVGNFDGSCSSKLLNNARPLVNVLEPQYIANQPQWLKVTFRFYKQLSHITQWSHRNIVNINVESIHVGQLNHSHNEPAKELSI